MKPIEPGCLAILINSKGSNNGLECQVKSFYGDSERYQDERVWRVDRKLPRYNKLGMLRGHDDLVPEHNLLRIDDPDLKKDQDTERPKVYVKIQ